MKILIVPGCDDNNRGDQALIWETVRVLKDAGADGDYYMISTDMGGIQSQKEMIHSTPYILPHPSTYFTKLNDNRKYTLKIKFLWGIRAIVDFCTTVPLLNKKTRKIAEFFLSDSKKKSLNLYKKIDIAVVKGGGFLHAEKGLVEAYKIYFFLFHIKLAISMGIPVFVMPNSYGPFKSKIARKLVRNTLTKCSIVTSRESISCDMLKEECGVSNLKMMDLGAYLQEDDEFEPIQYMKSKNIVLDKNSVVITVRPYRFLGRRDADKLYKKYICTLATFIIWLHSNGYFPVLVEHVYSDNYHESDMKAIEDIEKNLSQKSVKYAVLTDHSLNCRQLKSIYSCFDYMVGTRFHSVIFSLFSNVPSIAITYGGNKGNGIMRDLGLSRYAVNIEQIEPENLISMFKDMVANRERYEFAISKNKQIVETQRNELISLIRKGLEKR